MTYFARLWQVLIGVDLPKIFPKGLLLPHPYGVVISDFATIGSDCVIYQGVTIGSNREGDVPVLGRGVIVYPGAVIVGRLRIGEYAVIGANAVVRKSFPPHSVVAGNPARVIRLETDIED